MCPILRTFNYSLLQIGSVIKLYSKSLCIKVFAKLSKISICILFKRHLITFLYKLDAFLISSVIFSNVWENFSRASSSCMCHIIVVLFELSLHVTGLSSYFTYDTQRASWECKNNAETSKVMRKELVITERHSFSSSLFLVRSKRKHTVSSACVNVECFQVFNTECVSSIFHCSHSSLSHPHVYQSALWLPLDLKRNKWICNRIKEKAHKEIMQISICRWKA